MKRTTFYLIVSLILVKIVPAYSDFPIRSTNSKETEPVAVYNSADKEYLVVWNENNSIWGKRFNEDGSVKHAAFMISNQGQKPKVVYNSQTNKYLVIYVSNGVMGIIVDGSTLGTPVSLALNGDNPEIAYNKLLNEFLLVYYKKNASPKGIYSRRINPGGTANAQPPEDLGIYSDTVSKLVHAPIAYPNKPNGKYLLAESPGYFKILGAYGKRIDAFEIKPESYYGPGNSTGSSLKNGYIDDDYVDVAFGYLWGDYGQFVGPVFALAWSDQDNLFPSDGTTEVVGAWCAFINANNFESIGDIYYEAEPIDDGSYIRNATQGILPRVDYCAEAKKFVFAWRSDPTNDAGNNVKVKHIRVTSKYPHVSDAVMSATTGIEDPATPAIAASSNAASALVVWRDSRNIGTKDYDIYGSIYQVPQEKIIIDVPNGSENWEAGNPQPIVWHTQNFTGNVKIELSTDGGSTWTTIANNVSTPTANTATSYLWNVTNTPSTNCRIRISDASDGNPSDMSNANFTITSNPKIIVDVPNGGENWVAGTPQPIVWHSLIFTGNVKIEFSTDNGSSWTTIANNISTPTANTATSYMWNVSNTPSSNCLIKISDSATGNPSDESNNVFTIAPAGSNNTPTGTNVQVVLNSEVTVTFNNISGAGTTTLNKKNIGSPPPGGLTIVPAGSPLYYDINTTATYTGNITISIKYDDTSMTPAQEQALQLQVYEVPPGSWKDITTGKDMTANIISGKVNHLTDFAIMAPTGGPESITVIAPNGNETWQVGTQYEIKWTSANLTGQVKIEYSIDGNATHLNVINSTENDGSYLWTIPNTPSTQCVIIIWDATDGDPFDISDADFTISSNLPPAGGEIIVNNTDDSGTGSFRDAILLANTHVGMDTIIFNIPKNVPGYDLDVGVWTIEPQTALPAITDAGLLIDGFSQAAFIGEDANPDGPEIQIVGVGAGDGSYGLHIQSSLIDILGVTINQFSGTGIYVEGAEGGSISGCYIGLGFNGEGPAGNVYGIILTNGTRFFHVAPADTIPNVISGNVNVGVMVSDSSHHNVILANIIGLDKNRMFPIPNGNHGGIMISEKSDSNEVIDNVLCGNAFGIIVSGSNENFIANNKIGTYYDWEPFGNENDGIFLADSAQHNQIIENEIGHNGGNGIRILGEQTLFNTITQNFISSNGFKGIENSDGGNGMLNPPQLTIDAGNNITGTAAPNSTIEFYTDPENEGKIFHDAIMADGSGNFSWAGPIEGPFHNITATATDENGNTSEFSEPIQTTVENNSLISGRPVSFLLYQNYPNPFNPVTAINYSVPKKADITITIYNTAGEEIVVLVDENKPAGNYSVKWHGQNNSGLSCPSGLYFCTMKTENFIVTNKLMLLK